MLDNIFFCLFFNLYLFMWSLAQSSQADMIKPVKVETWPRVRQEYKRGTFRCTRKKKVWGQRRHTWFIAPLLEQLTVVWNLTLGISLFFVLFLFLVCKPKSKAWAMDIFVRWRKMPALELVWMSDSGIRWIQISRRLWHPKLSLKVFFSPSSSSLTFFCVYLLQWFLYYYCFCSTKAYSPTCSITCKQDRHKSTETVSIVPHWAHMVDLRPINRNFYWHLLCIFITFYQERWAIM